MDLSAQQHISTALQCLPVRIDTGDVCHCKQPRLYWTNTRFEGHVGDNTTVTDDHVDISLSGPQLTSLSIPDGWSLHPDFSSVFTCFAGFRRKRRPFSNPVGLAAASNEAKIPRETP